MLTYVTPDNPNYIYPIASRKWHKLQQSLWCILLVMPQRLPIQEISRGPCQGNETKQIAHTPVSQRSQCPEQRACMPPTCWEQAGPCALTPPCLGEVVPGENHPRHSLTQALAFFHLLTVNHRNTLRGYL